MNREKRNARVRAYRRRTNNAATKKYERTKKGKLMRCYRNMLSRVNGIQKKKKHLYENKEILPKDEFYEWALSSKKFHALYKAWVESEYDRKLTPTVDRLDASGGYFTENMEWVTHSENSRRGGRWRPSESK